MAKIPVDSNDQAYFEGVLRLSKTGDEPIFVTDVADVKVNLSNAIDNQKITGKNNGRIKSLGRNPAIVTITMQLYPKDLLNWEQKIYPILMPPGGNKEAAIIDVESVPIQRAGLLTFAVTTVYMGTPDIIRGADVTVGLIEFTLSAKEQKKQDKGKKKSRPVAPRPDVGLNPTNTAKPGGTPPQPV